MSKYAYRPVGTSDDERRPPASTPSATGDEWTESAGGVIDHKRPLPRVDYRDHTTPGSRQRSSLLSALFTSSRSGYAPVTTSPPPPLNDSDSSERDDENEKKMQASATQRRFHVAIIASMLVLIALFMLNRESQAQAKSSEIIARRLPNRAPAIVRGSPVPMATQLSIPIFPSAGLRHYSIVHPGGKEFAVYLPSSLARSDALKFYSSLPNSHPLYHSFPLVISLHGRTGNASTEVDMWIEYAERNQWIIVCPTLTTSAKADYASLATSVSFLQVALDSVMGVVDEADPRIPSFSLTRLIDRTRILLTAHSGGGYSFLAFALQRPNYWSALSCRSCNFWNEHMGEVLRPQTRQFATEAVRLGTWRAPTPIGIDTASEPLTDAHISEVFWSHFYRTRPILFQRGEHDLDRITYQIEGLQNVLRNEYGFRHVTQEVMPGEKHEPRVDITAKWFLQKVKDSSCGWGA